MGSLARKIRRNQLKKELGTNKIKQAFHERFDTLEQKLKRGLKDGKNNRI